jgi:hypothetical protein
MAANGMYRSHPVFVQCTNTCKETFNFPPTNTDSSWSKEAVFACVTIFLMMVFSSAGLVRKYGVDVWRRMRFGLQVPKVFVEGMLL